jgi:hypothetical protein
MLDPENTKTALQSKTVQAAIGLIVVNAAVVIAAFTGKTFDVEAIQTAVNTWLPMVANLLTMGLGFVAVQGRVNATQQISKPTDSTPNK